MPEMQQPIAIRHRSGAEWMRHIAGRALVMRAEAQQRKVEDAVWRAAEPFMPCG